MNPFYYLIKNKSIVLFFITTILFVFILSNLSYSQDETSPDEKNVNTTDQNLQDNESLFDTTEKGEGDELDLENIDTSGSFFTMLIVLVIIIGAIYLVIRWVSKKKNISFTGSDFAKIEGTKSIALNKYIQLVNIGEKYYLLGVADHSVNMLFEITDQEQLDKIKLSISQSKPLKPFVEQFKTSLKNMFGVNKSKEINMNQNSITNNNHSVTSETLNKKDYVEEKNSKVKNENFTKESIKDSPQDVSGKDSSFSSLLKNYESLNNLYDIDEKKTNDIKNNSENEGEYHNVLNNVDGYKSDKNKPVNKNNNDEKIINDKKVLSESDDDEILDDNTFDFIKKQRERLENLGIKIRKDFPDS